MSALKTSINENIRFYRKERKFTQEQLAEAMGVTVGAVSKWESGLSIPDISLIMELADFFGVSVDSLLGYKMRSNDVKDTKDRIKELIIEKKYDEGIIEAEKALQKYPNCFDIVYKSASLYQSIGIDQQNESALNKSLSLFERSLALIDQNQDSSVGKATIQKSIAEIYFCFNEHEKGLELLKKYNSDGNFDSLLGYVLAYHFHRNDEALHYLSDALINDVCELFQVAIGFANVYGNRKEYDLGIEVLLWCKSIHDGLKIPGKISFFDKSSVILLSGCAQLASAKGDKKAARKYLTEARKLALEFDADPDYTSKNIKFVSKEKPAASSDDFGSTAMEGIESAVFAALENAESKEETEKAEELIKIWEEVKEDE